MKFEGNLFELNIKFTAKYNSGMRFPLGQIVYTTLYVCKFPEYNVLNLKKYDLVYVVYDQSGQNNLNFPDIFNAKPPVNYPALQFKYISNHKYDSKCTAW